MIILNHQTMTCGQRRAEHQPLVLSSATGHDRIQRWARHLLAFQAKIHCLDISLLSDRLCWGHWVQSHLSSDYIQRIHDKLP